MRPWLGIGLLAAGFGTFAFGDAVEGSLPAQPPPKASAATSDASLLVHPDQLQTLIETQGTITTIDPARRLLMIQDPQSKIVAMHTVANTRILDENNHPLKPEDLRVKDRVRVYYNRDDFTAQQIDRVPSLGDVILGK